MIKIYLDKILTKDLPGENRSRRMKINAQLKIRMWIGTTG